MLGIYSWLIPLGHAAIAATTTPIQSQLGLGNGRLRGF